MSRRPGSDAPLRIAVIGGGAAGLMAAAAILETDDAAEVILIERNDGLGKKVIISGGGRCNVTTGIENVRTVLEKYPRGGKFLSSAMHRFPPAAVMRWFETRGVPLKVEDDLRVFPVSDDGNDVVRAFDRLFANHPRIRIMLRTHVAGIEQNGDGTFIIGLRDAKAPLVADRVILATGGQAYRNTGSTGDGYAFARSLGHSLTPLAPGLNAFFTAERWPAEISGLSFEKARITAKRGKGVTFTGPFLFTHRGISGPAVFALSSLVAFERYDKEHPLDIAIDVFPDATLETLRADIGTALAAHPGKAFRNVLTMLVPRSLSDIAVREAELDGEKKAAETGKKDVLRAAQWLKGIPLRVVQRGGGDEFVTAGGIPTSEVDPTTMGSRITPGLFFAGEILDVDGFTGGFNLQASWATGRLAGESAVK